MFREFTASRLKDMSKDNIKKPKLNKTAGDANQILKVLNFANNKIKGFLHKIDPVDISIDFLNTGTFYNHYQLFIRDL